MSRTLPLLLLVLASYALAHGDHSFDLNDANEAGLPYAERHMHTEHHIDSFDLESFFQLHDLNLDGYWDTAEIEAVYGLHHHSVKDKIPHPDAVEGRTKAVVDKVLAKLDTDGDGRISKEEFIAGGNEGLPSFEGYRDLGHHYDEESEYFLHHEELYHSTPETQTDESYTHAEDIEHFRHHQHIEDEEDARERKFEGLPEDADLSQDHFVADPLDDHAHAPGEGPDGQGPPTVTHEAGEPVPTAQRLQREAPDASPQRLQKSDSPRYGRDEWRIAKEEAQGKHHGPDHGRPRSPEERMRAGVPYKYKSVDQDVGGELY